VVVVSGNCAALLSNPIPQPFLAQIMKNGDTVVFGDQKALNQQTESQRDNFCCLYESNRRRHPSSVAAPYTSLHRTVNPMKRQTLCINKQ
jgi:hypothetical protein